MNISEITTPENKQGILATLTDFDEPGKTDAGKSKQKIKLRDNESTWDIPLYPGNNPPMTQKDMGKLFAWDIWFRVFKGKKYYYAFLNQPESVGDGAQNASQAAPQPTQAPQVKKEVDWDAKELREKRSFAVKDAMLLITTAATVTNNAECCQVENVKQVADELVNYVYNGLKEEPERDADNEDIPY